MPAERKTGDIGTRRILLVEDEAILAMGTVSMLRERGYAVEHLFTGESAVARIAEEGAGIDLILMDINLGEGMTGTRAAREILSRREIPIVFLSSHTEKTIVESTEEISSYGYVVKNSGITVLDTSIRMAFRLFEARMSVNAKSMALEAANEELRVAVEELTAANRKLALSEDKFLKAFLVNPDSIVIARLSDGVVIDANEGAVATSGYTREEAISRSTLEDDLGLWTRGEDRERLIRGLGESGEVTGLEAEFRRKDGSFFTGVMSAKLIEIEGEKCVLSITRDVTERKVAEDLLKDSESRFRAAFANAPVGMVLLSVSGDLRMMNRAFCAMLDYGMAEATSVDFKTHAHPEDIALREDAVRNVLGGVRNTIRYVARYLSKEGRVVWVDESVSLLRAEGGEAQGLVIHALDISERKLAEEKAAKLGRLRSAVSEAMQLIVRMPDRKRLLDGACRIAVERGAVGMAWIGLVEGDGLALRPFASAGAAGGHLDGLFFPGPAPWEPTGIALREGRLSICADIAEEERAPAWREKALARGYGSAAAFPLRSGYDSKVIGVFSFYSEELDFFGEGETALLSQMALDISFALDSIRGKEQSVTTERKLLESDQLYRESFRKSSAVKLLIDPVSFDIIDANLAASKFYGYALERLVRMKLTELNPSSDDETRERIGSVMSGEKSRFYFRHRLASGELRDVEVFSSPIEIGKRTLLHSIVHDISEQVQARAALKRLVVEKDTLMKELQHRVKNNLNVVTSLLELEDKKSLDAKAGQVLEDAIARVRSISAIYERLYLSDDLESVDLSLYVEDLAKSLFSTYGLDPARVTLRVRSDRVLLDSKRSVPLGLILNELLSNSLKYAYPAPAFGEIGVELASAGNRICLSVSDRGPGIPDAYLGPDCGSMGMTLVRMLTDQLGGDLAIENRGGTRVRITFAA